MNERRKGLGKGLGALIPNGPSVGDNGTSRREGTRPVDLFFAGQGASASGSLYERPVRSGLALVEPSQRGAAQPTPSGDADTAPGGESLADPHNAQHEAKPDSTVESSTVEAPAPADDNAHAAAEPAEIADEIARAEYPAESNALGQKATPPAQELVSESHEAARTAATDPLEDVAGAEVDLGALEIPDDPGELIGVPGAEFREIPLDDIRPNARQPRQVFDEDELAELVASIHEVGVLQPVVVRPVPGAAPSGGDSYELVMGERRWRACQQAGLAAVPAIVRQTPDTDLLRDALLENLHRSQLNPLEEAAAYDQLLKDFGCSHDELANRIGRSRPQISNTIRLLNLPGLVQRRVAAGVLSAGHARALLGLGDAGAMERLAQRIVAEGLSVRRTEEIVALGEDDSDEPRRRSLKERPRNEHLESIASRLSDRFDTRVKIAMGARRGRLTVEFAGVDDLERILAVLAPDVRPEAN